MRGTGGFPVKTFYICTDSRQLDRGIKQYELSLGSPFTRKTPFHYSSEYVVVDIVQLIY